MTTPTRADRVLGVLMILLIGILTAAVLGLAQAQFTDRSDRRNDRAEMAELREAVRAQAEVLGRRTPSLQFFVCWAAKVGDFLETIPELVALDHPPTPAELEQLRVISRATRDALQPTSAGGCVDDELPVDVPRPNRFGPPADTPTTTGPP